MFDKGIFLGSLANYFHLFGEPEKAFRLSYAAVMQGENSVRAEFILVRHYLKNKESLLLGVRFLRRLHAAGCNEATEWLGRFYLKGFEKVGIKKDYNTAKTYYLTVTRRATQGEALIKANAFYCLGQIYRNEGDIDEAIVSFQAAYSLDSKNAQAGSKLNKSLADKTTLNKAMRQAIFYQENIGLDSKTAETMLNEGLAGKSVSERIDHLQTVVKTIAASLPDVSSNASSPLIAGSLFSAPGEPPAVLAGTGEQQSATVDPRNAMPKR